MKVKTGTLNRIHKEYKYYQQEADKEHARVEAMKAAGADAHDLKQAVRGLIGMSKYIAGHACIPAALGTGLHHAVVWCCNCAVDRSRGSAACILVSGQQ
jgi:hypothetical protein